MSALLFAQKRTYDPATFTAKSGLIINIADPEWQLLSTRSKGWKAELGWIWMSSISDQHRSLMLDVYVQYARTKSASTTVTVIYGSKPHLLSGIPKLTELRAKWSGIPTHQKKGLNQFFGTLYKLGHREYADYHSFTKTHLDRSTSNVFKSTKGALNEDEYEAFCRSVNMRLQSINWQVAPSLQFFTSPNHFPYIRNSVGIKLTTAIVRRPIQICALKWCDLLPVGSRFNDPAIDPSNEVGSIGNPQFQLRIFHVKAEGRSWRTTPEKYPTVLSVPVSEALMSYKRLYTKGISLFIEKHGCVISSRELTNIISMMPMFLSNSFFDLEISSKNDLEALFTDKSRALHLSEELLTKSINLVPVESSRVNVCKATSNRLRHTILTRGAQRGLSATLLAKITGVTEPGARHYVDLNYKSRRMIDELYTGSEFLAAIFNNPLEQTSGLDNEVCDSEFNVIGGLHSKNNCARCPSLMGRPIGCYGCNNFRPILEADHRKVLKIAELKLLANNDRLLSPEEKLSLEKLEKQVDWIKRTINACDQVLEIRRGIK